MIEQRLVDLTLAVIVQGRGSATATQLYAGGLSAANVTSLTSEQVLVETASNQYRLREPLVDIDALVLAHWAIPAGVFGGLTTLVYRSLSVAQLVAFDVFVPEGITVPAGIADMRIRRHVLPPTLRAFGVETFTPSLPGIVAVPMFTPSVALAQVVTDEVLMEEDRQDGVLNYLAQYGRDAALTEALHHYGVASSVLERLIVAAGR